MIRFHIRKPRTPPVPDFLRRIARDPEGTFDIYTMKLSAGDPELRLIVTDGRHLIDPGQLRPAAGRVPGGTKSCGGGRVIRFHPSRWVGRSSAFFARKSVQHANRTAVSGGPQTMRRKR